MARPKKTAKVVEIKSRKRRSKDDGILFAWEFIETYPNPHTSHVTRRAKVIGGWLIEVFVDKVNQPSVVALSFISDPKHAWVVATPVATEQEPAPTPTATQEAA